MKTLPISVIFINCFHYRAYGANIFGELPDNEPSGCRWVVRGNSRKWGRFRGIVRGPVRRKAGGNGPENHCFVMVIPLLRACEGGRRL